MKYFFFFFIFKYIEIIINNEILFIFHCLVIVYLKNIKQ